MEVFGRLSILTPPDFELFPWGRRQLEKIPEEGDTLGPWRKLVYGTVPDGSDDIDRREEDRQSKC